MMHSQWRGALLLLALCLEGVSAGYGQLAAPAFAVPRSADDASLIEVSVPFAAQMRDGRPVTDLRPEDLRVVDNGMLVSRVRQIVRERDLPLQLIVVLDRSASITPAQSRQLDSLIELLHSEFDPARDTVQVWMFDETVSLAGAWETMSQQRVEVPVEFSLTHRTAIFDSLVAICAEVERRRTTAARRVLVLISDGEDNSSEHTLSQAADAAQRADISIYSVAIRLNGWEQGRYALEELAARTGGLFLDAQSEKKTRRALAVLSEDVRQRWRVVYGVPPMSGIRRHSFELLPLSKGMRFRAATAWHSH